MGKQNWYALRSKTNKEEFLWRNLEAQGIESYYPRIRVKPVNPRARTVKPFFPGYLFVRADLSAVGSVWFDRMPDAIGLVNFGGEPAEVDASLVAAIQKRVDTLPVQGTTEMAFRRGELVLISGGPFAGYTALFDMRLPGRERVRVLLQFLANRMIPVELAPSQLKAA
jgi:transcription antitermination factor NusG